jgi:hypothetical protein
MMKMNGMNYLQVSENIGMFYAAGNGSGVADTGGMILSFSSRVSSSPSWCTVWSTSYEMALNVRSGRLTFK